MSITKIKQFSNKVINDLRTPLQKDFDKIGKKYGITLHLGSVSYNDYEFKGKLDVKIANPKAQGALKEKKEVELHTYCKMLGFPVKVLKSTFTAGGRKFKVTDIKLSRPKYPFIAQCQSDKKFYKFSEEQIKRAFSIK